MRWSGSTPQVDISPSQIGLVCPYPTFRVLIADGSSRYRRPVMQPDVTCRPHACSMFDDGQSAACVLSSFVLFCLATTVSDAMLNFIVFSSPEHQNTC